MGTTPIQAISNVRDRIHATETTYTNDVGIKHYNWIYQDLTGDIQLLDEEYYYNSATDDTVIDQIEYLTTNVEGVEINQVTNVYVKYTTDQTDYIKLRKENPNNLPYDKQYYAVNQSRTDAFYYIQDNSIWIFPAATEVVTGGIKVEVIQQPPDLVTSSLASSVLVPTRIQRIIEEGMLQYAYEYIGKEEKVANAITLYDKKKKEALEQVKKRDNGVAQVQNNIQYNFQ